MSKHELLKKLIPTPVRRALKRVKNVLIDEFAYTSYSQEGEDMILNRIFEGRRDGFYVDVGAHHPRRFSNTYFFYKRGWTGINIEPNPDAIRTFYSQRSRDKNIQCGISDCEGVRKYYHFDDSALNTFDEEIVKSRMKHSNYRLVKHEYIPLVRLDDVLKKNLDRGVRIDFLTVDAEGFDLAVLKSNDWSLFRPSFILTEVLDASFEEAVNGEVAEFMRGQQYKIFAKTFNTLIFCEAE